MVSFIRRARDPQNFVVMALNFTPIVRYGYTIGVPAAGFYEEVLNSDAMVYGGSDVGNAGGVWAAPTPHHGHPFSLVLTLPPLGCLLLKIRK